MISSRRDEIRRNKARGKRKFERVNRVPREGIQDQPQRSSFLPSSNPSFFSFLTCASHKAEVPTVPGS